MGALRVTFAVPAGAGDYAPEVMYLNGENNVKAMLDSIKELLVNVEALAGAGAIVEIDILKPGGHAQTAGDWATAAATHNTAGLKAIQRLCGAMARIRVKSGGAAGNTIVSAYWF